MAYIPEQTVDLLLNEFDQVSMSSAYETQTRRSEIFEEILRLLSLSLEARQKVENIAKHGRWV